MRSGLDSRQCFPSLLDGFVMELVYVCSAPCGRGTPSLVGYVNDMKVHAPALHEILSVWFLVANELTVCLHPPCQKHHPWQKTEPHMNVMRVDNTQGQQQSLSRIRIQFSSGGRPVFRRCLGGHLRTWRRKPYGTNSKLAQNVLGLCVN